MQTFQVYFLRELLLLPDSFDLELLLDELAFLLLPLLFEDDVDARGVGCFEDLALLLLCPEPELPEDFRFTDPDDLLFVTVLCPAAELLLALLLTVVVDRGIAALFCLVDELPLFEGETFPEDLFVLPADLLVAWFVD